MCFLPETEWNLRHCLFGWDFHQGGQRISLPNTWGGWRGGCRACTEWFFGVRVDDTRHKRCSRPAEHTLWERPGHVQEIQSILKVTGCLAGIRGKQPSWAPCCSVCREACEGGRPGLGEVGSRPQSSSLCWGAAEQHYALNQLQMFWLLCPVCCSKVNLDLVQKVARSC